MCQVLRQNPGFTKRQNKADSFEEALKRCPQNLCAWGLTQNRQPFGLRLTENARQVVPIFVWQKKFNQFRGLNGVDDGAWTHNLLLQPCVAYCETNENNNLQRCLAVACCKLLYLAVKVSAKCPRPSSFIAAAIQLTPLRPRKTNLAAFDWRWLRSTFVEGSSTSYWLRRLSLFDIIFSS